MTTGERLRELRLERGLTQARLAAPDYTAAYVSSIENGRRRPSMAALTHFASTLHTSLGELVDAVGESARLRNEVEAARAELLAGHHDGARSRLTTLIETAKEKEWTAVLVEALHLLASSFEQAGDLDEAEELYAREEAAAEGLSALKQVDAVAGRARCKHLSGDIDYAIYLLEAMQRRLEGEQLLDPRALARIHTSLIAAYFDAGLLERAYDSAELVLTLEPRLDEPERVAMMHINVARIQLEKGRYAEAHESFARAEDLFRALEWPAKVGQVHLARGYALIRQGHLELARDELERAHQMALDTSSSIDETRALLQLGKVARLQGDASHARFLLRSVQNNEATKPAERGLAARELGLCALDAGETEIGLAGLEEAIGFFQEAGDNRELAHTYRLLGDLMRDQHELAQACDAYRNAALALERAA